MAISPGIPTSFVPKQPVPVTRRPMRSANNVFLVASLLVALVVCLVALGMFAYGKYLDHVVAARQQELTAAQSKVDESTVEDFIRLRDRLANSQDILTNHVVLSQFLDDLESLTLQNVRFDTMQLIVAGDHSASIDLTGTAKSFNALAAQSNAFAMDTRIKRAIFSGINIDPTTNLVSFHLIAQLDPSLVVQGSKVLTPPASTTSSAADNASNLAVTSRL